MSYIVLARKYRPETFSQVCSQEHIVRIFQNAIEKEKIGQAYLFTGSRGVGKTSIARILAKSLNCQGSEKMTYTPCGKCANCEDIKLGISPDVVEIDGASNTGVDDVRELQKELLYTTSQSRYKIIIIDEVHMLSKNAFNALLKTLEEPPPNVVFIFATTEPHKVLPTIISRCQRFDFRKIPIEAMVARLKEISTLENINIEDEALYLIAKKADGGMRDALSIMDQVISYGLEQITARAVQQIFGLIDFDIFNGFMVAITNRNPAEMLALYAKTAENGVDIQEFINNFLEYLRQFMFIKLNITPPEIAKTLLDNMKALTQNFTEDEIIYIINFLIETKNNLRTSSSPEILAELTFVKLAKISEMKSLKTVLEELDVRPQKADVRPQTADVRPQTADVRPQTADSRPQTADVRPQTADIRPQTAEYRPQTADSRSQAVVAPPAVAKPPAPVSTPAPTPTPSTAPSLQPSNSSLHTPTSPLETPPIVNAENFIKNPTLADLQRVAPEFAEFVKITDSTQKQG